MPVWVSEKIGHLEPSQEGLDLRDARSQRELSYQPSVPVFSLKWGTSHRCIKDNSMPPTQGLQLPTPLRVHIRGGWGRACATRGHTRGHTVEGATPAGPWPTGQVCAQRSWWKKRRRRRKREKNPLISEEMSQIRFVNQKPIYNMQELICFNI